MQRFTLNTRRNTGELCGRRIWGACACSTAAAGSSSSLTEPVRLNKRLSELGLCSRRESDSYIERGLVEVDGNVVSVLGTKVTRQQRVALTATAEAKQRAKLTVILNKPRGFISCSPNSPRQRPAARLLTAANYDRRRGNAHSSLWPFAAEHGSSSQRSQQRSHLPKGWTRGLAPAGRLDMDSSGMLIFTQDGTLARALVGGEGKVEKEYHVTVARKPALRARHLWGNHDKATVVNEEQLGLLRHGLQLDGRQLRPALVSIVGTQIGARDYGQQEPPSARRKPKRARNRDLHGGATTQSTVVLRFVLREGRYRQIRRMCDAVGLNVLYLHRVRIGNLALDDLRTGYWRFATEADILQLTYSGGDLDSGGGAGGA
jgi:23S rRNA pseudouridine2604 synthase